MSETTPPMIHESKNIASLETFAATMEGVRKIPTPTTTPTMIAHASISDRVGRGAADSTMRELISAFAMPISITGVSSSRQMAEEYSSRESTHHGGVW